MNSRNKVLATNCTNHHGYQRVLIDEKQSNFDKLPNTAYMRASQVLEVVPISPATLWRKCKAGQFPKPVKLSERVTAWKVSSVRAWLETQAQA